MEGQSLHVRGLEQQVGAEERPVVTDADGGVLNVVAGGVPAAFVELAVGRQVGLRDDAEDLTAVDDDRAVVEPVAVGQGCADDEDGHEVDTRGDERFDGVGDGVEQYVLEDEVIDGIAGEAELGEHGDADMVVMQFAGGVENALCIGHRVGDGDRDGDGGDAGEAVGVGPCGGLIWLIGHAHQCARRVAVRCGRWPVPCLWTPCPHLAA